jgi:hypothetical protein
MRVKCAHLRVACDLLGCHRVAERLVRVACRVVCLPLDSLQIGAESIERPLEVRDAAG